MASKAEERAQIDAYKRVEAWLRKNAGDLTDDERERAKDRAFDRWRDERKNKPEQYAAWARGDARKEAKRRRTLADTSATELVAGTGANQEDILAFEPKSKQRERRYAEAEQVELGQALEKRCREALLKLGAKPTALGLGWAKRLVRKVDGLGAAEAAARAAFCELRDAMLKAEALAISTGGEGPCLAFLRGWVPEYISPLLAQTAIAADPDGETRTLRWSRKNEQPGGPELRFERSVHQPRWDPIDGARDSLARALRMKDFLGLGRHHRELTPREMALVWLAAGGRPKTERWPATVGEIIDFERQNFDAALTRLGGSRTGKGRRSRK